MSSDANGPVANCNEAEDASAPEGSKPAPKTTTISTIAVQSGKTRLVIALLQSGDWIQLKILEVEPGLTKLGATLAEALEFQKAHDDVLLQLQNKQSPVEELLRQADQLISTQRPRAEVYAAMAESLGRAWQDVNAHLELRKHILDLNVLYHRRANDFHERVDALEASCHDTMVPIEIEAVKRFLTNIHEQRRAVLEALMAALQTGNQLLAKLKELSMEGTLDSRPERIRTSVNRAISQVEKWLDELHVKRQLIELSWQTRKTQLEQCLALALLAKDLRELEDAVSQSRELLTNTDHLGDSASSAELLLHEHKKLIPEARQLQERAIKLTKATEQLVSSGCFAGEQATAQAYTVLAATSDYLTDLDARENLLNKAITFFRKAHTALTKLDQLEVQLTTTDLPSLSSSLAQLHGQCARTIEEVTSAPLEEGHQLLNEAGRGRTGTEGIKRMVEELENRKIFLDGLCTAHREENLRISQALTTFLEKQNDLYSWLVSIAEAFLQGHQDMGSDLPMAKDFLNLHNQLLNDLQTKGNEINSLLLTLPPILEFLNDVQRRDVDAKVESLHEHWLKLKNILEVRLDLAAVYVRFHTEAETVNKAMDELENSLKNSSPDARDNVIEQLQEKWSSLLPLYQQAKNTGLNFISQSKKVSEPHLDTKRACLCVESVLERLAARQLVVTQTWQTFHTEIQERRELLVQWQKTMTESTQTIDWVSKLDAQFYPVITTISSNPRDISSDLERKLTNVLNEIRKAQSEVEDRIKTAEILTSKSQKVDETAFNIKKKLNDLNQKLVQIITEYQILLEMMISYFKNLSELDKTVENVNNQYVSAGLPADIYEVEAKIREHEASKQAILEMFKFTQNEREQVITRIRKQEPAGAADHDVQKLLYILDMRKKMWETAWNQRKDSLDQHRQLCQFNTDLHQINETLDDLSRQLAGVKGQYGESIASAKATSLAFVYFEKTIELLEQRIATFVNTGEQLLADRHVHSPHIERELSILKRRWSDFQKQVQDTRRLIDLSIQYFQLVDEADEWFREGSKLLVTIARKSTSVKKPEEATELLNEVALFLKPGEERQNERIKKISSLAAELYGIERSKQVTQVMVENREMLESFSVIKNELNTLAQNLKSAEEQRDRLKKEQEEADANLAAIKAEAAAAEAAAAAAEEARKAAEAAAKALRESIALTEKKVHIIQVQSEVQTLKPQEKKPPTPEPIIQVPPTRAPEFTVPLTDAVIQEGSKFTFECHVTGYPLPVVTWHKDGISIQNNPDYQTTFDQGICTLTIEETFAEDSAKYTCKAINAAGTAETGASLSVKETEPEEQLIPPTFTKILEPATAKEGSTFKFECKVEGNPLPTVQWFKNYECIDNSPDFVITYNNGEAILKFEEVFLEDKAEYTCKATNELGMAQSTASLSVEPLEPTVAPEFVVPLSNVMARAGQKIRLECEVSGLPQPTLLLTHNGKPLKESRDIKLQCDNNRATVVISEAFPKDAGTYVVTATNIAGEAVSACNVSVKGRLPTETSDSELASDMEPIKPSIQVALKDTSVFEGKRVRLDCIIVGQPEPEVIWYHDNRPVKESTDFQLLFQGDRCSLIIQEAFTEDAGMYKVIAINSAGEASSQCHLTVTPVTAATDAKPETKPLEEKQVGSPPKFTKLLSDVLVCEGDQVILNCTVSGDPKPDIRWLLNNQEIHPSDHFKFSHDLEGNVKLEIEHVVPDDKGVYTVKASNPSGDAKCFAQLIVKSLRPVDAGKVHEEAKIAPSFKELFSDRTCFQDQSTKFECIVTGKPTPKIKWLFNGEAVSGKDFLVSTSGERQVLSIPTVSVKNQGKITCVAENEAGKASCEANLKVEPVAQPVITFPETQISSHIDQHSESSYSVKREVFVQSSSSSKVMSSSTGGEPDVQVHSLTSQDQHSFKQINQQAPEIKESHHREEFKQIGKEPPVISEKSFSSFISGQESKIEETVKSTAERSIIHKPVRKAQPPRFVTPVVGKIVDQGVDVTLEGIVDGYPTPEVTWSKNGTTLVSTDSMKITYELNHAKLVLKNVTVKDAGKYTCTAVNEAGSAVSTTDLVVKKTIFPPVFGRRLQAQVVKKGERLVMEVEVTGTPEPTVTWHKDDHPIESVLKDGYRTKTQGNSHTLIIEKATMNHTGKYMVRAVNSGGEAQSIADIAVFEPTPETMVEMVKTVVFEDVQKQEFMSSADKSKTVTTTPVSKPVTIEIPVTVHPERKPSPVVSPVPFSLASAAQSSTLTESRISQTTTKFTLEHSTSPIPPIKPFEPVKPPEVIKPVEIPVRVETQPPKPEVYSEETGIETSSISKQSSLDFFVSKMKASEEPAKPTKVIETQKISPEVYTKFEDVSSVTKLEPVVTHDVKTEFHKSVEKDSKVISSSRSEEYKHFTSKQSQLFEEFNLKPEPPPEIGFIPKSETIQKKEDVTVKIKRLEDSHRDLSPVEVPSGAVKIFPTAPPKPREEVEQKKEVVKETYVKITPKPKEMEQKKEVKETFVKITSAAPPKPREEVQTKKQVVEEIHVQKKVDYSQPTIRGWAPVSFKAEPKKEEPAPVLKPQVAAPRPVSPRPSTRAVEMEKLWTPQVPQGPRPVSAPVIPEPVRVPSPKPSPQGVAMEKLWTQKTVDTSYSTSFSKPAPAQIPAAVEPSVQGKTMEKIWAHKHSDSQLKTMWPPQQTEVEKQWTASSSMKSESVVKESSSTMKNESFMKEFRSVQSPVLIPEPAVVIMTTPQPEPTPKAPVQHYIASVSHTANIATQQFSSSFSTRSENVEIVKSHHENIIEDHQAKASEIIKSWPPAPIPKEEVLKAPQMVKETVPKIDYLSLRPVSVLDITNEVVLEPGPPPEIGFAQAPRERRQSYVESIEQDLEKNLEKEPSRVLPLSVRTIPPPLPPKKEPLPQAPPLPAKSFKVEPKKKTIIEDSRPFERFPDLEPFPFKPEAEKPKSPRPPPPPTPSRFIKGRFGDSDYESDFESVRIPPKWKPCASDTEEPAYRKVKPPKLSDVPRRSRSTEPEPLPPSRFEQPPQVTGHLRPAVDLETTKRQLRKDKEITTTTLKQTRREFRAAQTQVQKPPSPPDLKPGSPPVYVQTEPRPKRESPKPKRESPKPDSPKAKVKVYNESGYMADTDEPLTLTRKTTKVEHHRREESSRTEIKQTYESSAQSSQKITVETRSSTLPQVPPKVTHKYDHKKHVTSTTASKKELVAPIVSVTNEKVVHRDDRDSSLEPFPFKPEPQRSKRVKGPPPPSPSKFVKGEFKGSDYESDYEGRIPPVWRPHENDQDPAYKPVQPLLTPSDRYSRASTGGRTPTPPTEFDQPPQIEYPPRPKFEPIEKPKQTVKLDEILKSSTKQVVVKPKPVAAKPAPMMELVIATPAVPEPLPIKPGSPPEIAYAPAKKTQYYRSVTSMPYHNATQTETSNIMHFNEATEKSHRVVSVQQTTRVIKFGESQTKREEQHQVLEPFPFKPEPERPTRTSGPPPPKPKKFVRGEFRESDYESEVESARIRARWTPGYSDSDEPHYRKVRAPPPVRASSVPVSQQRVLTPMDFDTQPPVISSISTVFSKDATDGETHIKRVTDVRKRFGESQSRQVVKQARTFKSNDMELQPGSPPEYAYSPVTVPVTKATEMASQHMENMTHTFKSKTKKFVDDIITDMKTPQKPILKAATDGDTDAQAYREESRVAQHGTKLIDPDTGLIYFKYDFGYEFGVILPGQSKNGEIPQPRKTIIQPPKRLSDIELPVYHETTKPSQNSTPSTNKAPQFRPKKISQTKNVKWEPTSESEMSEIEGELSYKKRHSLPQPADLTKMTVPHANLRWEQASTSPVSLSPSLPSMSPAFNTTFAGASGSSWLSPGKVARNRGADTPPSTPSTPGSTQAGHQHVNSSQPKKAPIFITPLRDIAVVSGQTARFECIVQSEPPPSILWSKNGRIIENSQDYQLQYRNGVCRLTIPQAYPEDAGTYTCTATNLIGAVNTTATLQVPGERRSTYIK